MDFPQRTRDNHDNYGSLSLFAKISVLVAFTAFMTMGLLGFSAYSISMCIESESTELNTNSFTSNSPANITTTNTGIATASQNSQHPQPFPDLLPTDRIYMKARNSFVIPEYKLIFFAFPKVACSEWKKMFMQMNGNKHWCKVDAIGFDIHKPENNKILTLADYPAEIAAAMMTSPLWTRAAIVREPKERVLSAFLDKVFNHEYFVQHCCRRIPKEMEEDRVSCEENRKDFGSFLKFVKKYPKECHDVHWEAQVLKIDAKWWPYIDFVGHQHNVHEDAETLLSSLYSNRDLKNKVIQSAWDRYGKKGWGDDDKCEEQLGEFMEENSSIHNFDSRSQLLEWYTPELEKVVEEQWAVEWEQEETHFEKIKLFPGKK